jgi:hypothetical protein
MKVKKHYYKNDLQIYLPPDESVRAAVDRSLAKMQACKTVSGSQHPKSRPFCAARCHSFTTIFIAVCAGIYLAIDQFTA